MNYEEKFKKETGLDAYSDNNLRPKVPSDYYVEWLEEQLSKVGDVSILIKGLVDFSNWNDEKEKWFDNPGHCANITLIKYYNSNE